MLNKKRLLDIAVSLIFIHAYILVNRTKITVIHNNFNPITFYSNFLVNLHKLFLLLLSGTIFRLFGGTDRVSFFALINSLGKIIRTVELIIKAWTVKRQVRNFVWNEVLAA